MKNNDNQNRIYDKTLKTWIDVPADYYLEYDRERTAFRKRMQDHGRCCCPRSKWWLCDTFCDKCVFRRVGDLISIDATEGDDDVYMLDHLEAAGPRMEDVVADRDLLARMVRRLRELDPEADAIAAVTAAYPESFSTRFPPPRLVFFQDCQHAELLPGQIYTFHEIQPGAPAAPDMAAFKI